MFDKYKIISFDIFDTLLERKVFNPIDIFGLMSFDLEEKYNLQNFNFAYIRKLAEKNVVEKNRNNNIEEVSFDEIYEEVSFLTNFSKDIIEKIKQLEITMEANYLIAKLSGKELFNLAVKKNKQIVLISDTYFNKETIQFFLKNNGYNVEDNNIYLSSDLKYKKQNGKIYNLVFRDVKNKKEVLHIGDNYEADVINAKKYGIDALHEPSRKEKYIESKFYKEIFYPTKDVGHLNHNFLHGIISFEENVSKENFLETTEDLAKFGFAPLVLGFTQWLIQTSIRDGVKDLYFLARDGKVMKEAYDILSKNYQNAPQSHYVLASRKACNTIKLNNFYEILNVLKIPYTNVEIKDLFYQRFSLEEDDYVKIIRNYGFHKNSKVTQANDNNKIIEILNQLKDKIFDIATKEKELYFDYLKKEGLLESDNIAVVDIGYTGTMQGALSNLINKNIKGYYLITFYEAIDKVYKYGNDLKAYLGNFDNKINSNKDIIKKIPLYETLFSSEDCSFIKFKRNEFNEVEAIYQEKEENEELRIIFLKKLHSKTIEIIAKFADCHKNRLKHIYFDPYIMNLPLNYCFNDKKNIKNILNGVYFEDRYTGAVLNNVHSYYQEIKFNIFNKIIFNLMLKFLPYKKKKKLENNTAKFFIESKKNHVRLIGRYCFGVKYDNH